MEILIERLPHYGYSFNSHMRDCGKEGDNSLEYSPLPKYATKGSAAFDLHACVIKQTVLKAGEKLTVSSGIKVKLPNNTALLVYPRSGHAFNSGIILVNSVGVIDSDYRGEIKIGLVNTSDKDFIISPFMRIAQAIVTPILQPTLVAVQSLDDITARGEGGFGSTGI